MRCHCPTLRPILLGQLCCIGCVFAAYINFTSGNAVHKSSETKDSQTQGSCNLGVRGCSWTENARPKLDFSCHSVDAMQCWSSASTPVSPLAVSSNCHRVRRTPVPSLLQACRLLAAPEQLRHRLASFISSSIVHRIRALTVLYRISIRALPVQRIVRRTLVKPMSVDFSRKH